MQSYTCGWDMSRWLSRLHTHSKRQDLSHSFLQCRNKGDGCQTRPRMRASCQTGQHGTLDTPQRSGTTQRGRKCFVRGPDTMHTLHRERCPRGHDPQTLTQWEATQCSQILHKNLPPSWRGGDKACLKSAISRLVPGAVLLRTRLRNRNLLWPRWPHSSLGGCRIPRARHRLDGEQTPPSHPHLAARLN